ncbi:MAG: DNA gyrase inhibitor YacG, partial [Candidatus Binatia bacterium]
ECQLPKLDVAGSSPVTRSTSMAELERICPTCKRAIQEDSSGCLPFCSSRCRLIDLSHWLDGSYRLPDRSETDPEPQSEDDPR